MDVQRKHIASCGTGSHAAGVLVFKHVIINNIGNIITAASFTQTWREMKVHDHETQEVNVKDLGLRNLDLHCETSP